MKIINLLIEWIGLATVIPKKKKKNVYLVVHLISFKKQCSVYKIYVGKFRSRLIELASFKPKLLIRFIVNKTC